MFTPKLFKSKWLGVLAVAPLALIAQSASAALITASYSDNDCSGYFGTGFDSCQIFANDNENIKISPVIAKFNQDLASPQINTGFPSVDGSEWSFSNIGYNNDREIIGADWSYTAGTNDPGIRYWAAKSANGFDLYWNVADANMGLCGAGNEKTLTCMDLALVTDTGNFSLSKGLSHITFYDSVPPEKVPAPGTALLLGLGLLGMARMRKGKS